MKQLKRHENVRSMMLCARIGMLALALLLVQTLGIIHGVLHSSTHNSARLLDQAVESSKSRIDKDMDAGQGLKGLFVSLFAAHQAGSDCQLFDHASHGSAAIYARSANLQVVHPSEAISISQSKVIARWATLFDARGPPLNL